MSRQKGEDLGADGGKEAGRPADWQLPEGVDRGLWDYVTAEGVARGYDAGLAASTLFRVDVPFVERHCPVNGRLIDLGCGTGRLLVPLARRGAWAMGVDLSAPMLRIARDRACEAGVTIDLLHANLTRLDGIAAGSFDCAACLFSTLGMVRGSEERRRVVAHAFRVLRPGGRFVVHVHNRWFNLWNREGRRWLLGNGVQALAGRAEAGDRRMPVHQGIANLTLHLFTRREILRLLGSVGFRVIEVWPVGLGANGRLRLPWLLGRLRAYGYLVAAERP
jgi:SAM-dependent methyltransferase